MLLSMVLHTGAYHRQCAKKVQHIKLLSWQEPQRKRETNLLLLSVTKQKIKDALCTVCIFIVSWRGLEDKLQEVVFKQLNEIVILPATSYGETPFPFILLLPIRELLIQCRALKVF